LGNSTLGRPNVSIFLNSHTDLDGKLKLSANVKNILSLDTTNKKTHLFGGFFIFLFSYHLHRRRRHFRQFHGFLVEVHAEESIQLFPCSIFVAAWDEADDGLESFKNCI
jgi:hypothetical protein